LSIAILTPSNIPGFRFSFSTKENPAREVCHGLDLNAEDWASDERGCRIHSACGIRNGAAWSGDANAKRK
jgi:hypothetical protein